MRPNPLLLLALAAGLLFAAPACTKECLPQCDGLSCGADGCGGTCGTCSSGLDCVGGRCGCTDGKSECDARCVDLQANPFHCGDCGNACDPGLRCVAGACRCSNADEKLCGGQCVSLATDANCGDCGVACKDGNRCIEGRCQCPTGAVRCGDKCVDPTNDPKNCGQCGAACSTAAPGAVAVCTDGRCGRRCTEDPPAELCAGANLCCDGSGCVDPRTDPKNCGACGKACPSDTAAGLAGFCDAGTCRQRCANDPPGKFCAKPSSGGAAACGADGVCSIGCSNPAETICASSSGAGSCVNLATDDSNCGACRASCTSRQDCLEKVCAGKLVKCTVSAGGWQTCAGSFVPGGASLAIADTKVKATDLVDIVELGVEGTWVSACFATPGRPTGTVDSPYSIFTGDIRYDTGRNYDELLWRVVPQGFGTGPSTRYAVHGFNDGPVAAGADGELQLRINVADANVASSNCIGGELQVSVGVTRP